MKSICNASPGWFAIWKGVDEYLIEPVELWSYSDSTDDGAYLWPITVSPSTELTVSLEESVLSDTYVGLIHVNDDNFEQVLKKTSKPFFPGQASWLSKRMADELNRMINNATC